MESNQAPQDNVTGGKLMVPSQRQMIRGYELQGQLGVGGFGTVYLAYQPLIKREFVKYPICEDKCLRTCGQHTVIGG